jgi:hypothetical protein
MAGQVFIGREAELAKLAASWEQAVAGVPQLVAVWGRRRVGEHPVPVLVGEAKWQHDPMPKCDLHAVLHKSAALPDTDATPQLAFWARNGFELDALAQPDSQSEPWVFRPADMF